MLKQLALFWPFVVWVTVIVFFILLLIRSSRDYLRMQKYEAKVDLLQDQLHNLMGHEMNRQGREDDTTGTR